MKSIMILQLARLYRRHHEVIYAEVEGRQFLSLSLLDVLDDIVVMNNNSEEIFPAPSALELHQGCVAAAPTQLLGP